MKDVLQCVVSTFQNQLKHNIMYPSSKSISQQEHCNMSTKTIQGNEVILPWAFCCHSLVIQPWEPGPLTTYERRLTSANGMPVGVLKAGSNLLAISSALFFSVYALKQSNTVL